MFRPFRTRLSTASLTGDEITTIEGLADEQTKRITDELGRSLTDPADIAELGTALRALTMFPGAAHLPPVP